jgi:plastocyanin
MRIKNLFYFVLFSLSIFACGSDDDTIIADSFDVGITLSNVGNASWIVTNVTGAIGIVEINTNNASITLEANKRYRFVNNGGASHPLDFRNTTGAVLLAQGNTTGSFETVAGVDFKSDSQGITFTLTEALFNELVSYHCSIHGTMRGAINPTTTEPEPNTDSDVQITFINIQASAYQVRTVTGATGVATLNINNPTLTLTTGVRYAITNQGGSAHPLALRNSANTVLLGQEIAGTLATDKDTDFVVDGDKIYFTLTSTLATQLDNYVCTFHAAMVGDIVVR